MFVMKQTREVAVTLAQAGEVAVVSHRLVKWLLLFHREVVLLFAQAGTGW